MTIDPLGEKRCWRCSTWTTGYDPRTSKPCCRRCRAAQRPVPLERRRLARPKGTTWRSALELLKPPPTNPPAVVPADEEPNR